MDCYGENNLLKGRLQWEDWKKKKDEIFAKDAEKNVLGEMLRDTRYTELAERYGLIRPFLLLVSMTTSFEFSFILFL